ncbi:citrate synthase [Candidatus Anaplasma sp. TIGMIC]|nr:citrate synthase [Candidatus Anaplasma sp. TIGMIC]MDB1135623.1 citrate synthase [Candidatus Anaplasma sp. TIGMIC]
MLEKAVLTCGDLRIGLPVLHGVDGAQAVDVTTLYKDHRVLTYDPGFMSTASCKSGITFIDGDEGVLRYRGIDIEDLINIPGGFGSVARLLLYGALPNDTECQEFLRALKDEYHIPSQVLDVIRSFSHDSQPMAILIAAAAVLADQYQNCSETPLKRAIIAIAKMPGIVAATYRHLTNSECISSDSSLEYTQNFLHMMFGPTDRALNDVICKALDAIFVMHADHEQNASTTAVRMTGSSGANLFACLCSGIATLWGPLHGGANEAVIKMLEEIGDPGNVDAFVSQVKENKKSRVRLMGFGHRVYKNHDPRAKILRKMCRDVLNALGKKDPLLDIAEALEQRALHDEYFIKRKLYPNVDFYSGIALRAMGVPVKMYTALFALARTAGWVSQWYEMIQDTSGVKISRPRQLYIGE